MPWRSADRYCCACAYLPSYCDSASMTRQSAPVRTAWTPSVASAAGASPYTYCQAQTWMPAAFTCETNDGENCDHQLVPSELLTMTVLTPYCRAWATIAAGVPPLD